MRAPCGLEPAGVKVFLRLGGASCAPFNLSSLSPPLQLLPDSYLRLIQNIQPMTQAIPPAYTEYIGNAMRKTLFKAV